MREGATQTASYPFQGKLDDIRIYDGISGNLVAEWLFEDGAGFLSDTSGNGHDLVLDATYTGVTANADVMSGYSGTSAAFDGAGQLTTATTLDLTSYNKLRFTYRVKDEPPSPSNGVSIFMEHSTNAYGVPGGFVFSSEEEAGSGCTGIAFGPLAKTNRNIERTGVTTGEWIDYDVTIDQTATTYEDVVLVTKNGVLQSDNTVTGRQAVAPPWDPTMAYPNELIYIGARGGATPSLAFLGYLDEMKLEAFTDPVIDLPGDANGDGVVDDEDASVLGAHWLMASGAAWEDGDFNADGKVDDRDAAILAAHWGQTAESSPSVPEPGVLVLVAGGLIALLARRRRIFG
jgi:hypothetical protein